MVNFYLHTHVHNHSNVSQRLFCSLAQFILGHWAWLNHLSDFHLEKNSSHVSSMREEAVEDLEKPFNWRSLADTWL